MPDKATHPSITMVNIIAERLNSLSQRFAFLGGAATIFLITDPAAPDLRITKDVDLIIKVDNRNDYYLLEEELQNLGAKYCHDEDAPICRWVLEGTLVDIMPTKSDILGFAQSWYEPAIEAAIPVQLNDKITAFFISAPYFLATKLEAFKSRGNADYFASHDLEDIIAVVDGRQELLMEVKATEPELKHFISVEVSALLGNEDFHYALPRHLPPDPASQTRIRIITTRLQEIADLRQDVD